MRKKFLILGFLFIVLVMTSACSSQSKPNLQSVPKEEDLLILANNISLKTGTNFSGDTVLESEDFIGFNYKYSESQKEYIFTFKLTDEGQEKMADATTKLAETSGDLSLWISDELITSSKVMEPVTGDAFAVYMVDVNEGNISNFVAKLEGRQQTPDVLPGIDDWNKEIISDKPDKTHVRYYVLKEDGNEETVLDVYAMTEEHDLDKDGLNEIVVYLPGEKRNIGIYDLISGELNYIDVSSELDATWSEYMGNMGNLQSKYLNYIEVGFEKGDVKRYEVYQYKNNTLIYLCPFDDTLLMQ